MKTTKFWIPLLAGLIAFALMLTPLMGVSSVRAATINVDGDLSDWAGLTTFADSPSDAGGGSGDLTALWITFDSTNLYLRWDMYLTSNTSSVKSDAFAALLSNDGSGTMNAKVWVFFNSSGVPTTQIEYPLGTFTTVGSAAQSCSFSPCANGDFVGIEAAVPYSGFNAGNIIGLAGLTLASTSYSSNVKDCIPGGSSCSGFISINRSTGEIAQATPTSTPTSTSTFTATGSPTQTYTPSFTSTFTATSTQTYTPSDTATFTATSTSTYTPSDTATFTATATETYTPSNTATSTSSSTNTSTASQTFTPSNTATRTPTRTPSRTPTRTLTASITPTITGTPGKLLPLGLASTSTFTATPTQPTATFTASSSPTFTPSAEAVGQFFVTATPSSGSSAPLLLGLPGGGKLLFLSSDGRLQITNEAGMGIFAISWLQLGLLVLLVAGALVAAPMGILHLIVALPTAFDLELRNITDRIPVVRVSKVAQALDYDGMQTSLGWLKRTAAPGKRGTCVVAGPYQLPDGRFGAFAQLVRLRQGDEVLLLPRNDEFTYIVQSVERVKDPAYLLNVNEDEAGLVLLTKLEQATSGESYYLVVKALLSKD